MAPNNRRSLFRGTPRLDNRLLAAFLFFLPLSAAWAGAPEICRVQGGNTKTIWGAGFTLGRTEVRDWKAPFDADAAWAALSSTPYRAADFLPETPPAGSRSLKILDADPRGLIMAVESEAAYNASGFYDGRAGGHVCWVKNEAGWSAPWRITSAQPWWVSPNAASPGGTVRIFGRTLDARLVAIKACRDGQVTPLTDFQRGQHPLYEVRAKLPDDLVPGDYELFVHNGSAGEAGWGGPIRIQIAPLPEPVTRFFDVRDFGAKGNGHADDTTSLRQALIQAGEAGGGTVHLPPGLYAISATLWTPPGVTLQGAGGQNSVLIVRDERPMRWDVPAAIAREMPGHFRARQQDGGLGAMVWMQDRSRVADLGLVDGPGTLQPIFGSRDACRIERCHIRATHSTQPAVMVEWRSDGFVLKDSVIESASGGVFLVHGPHTQALVSGNTIRNLHPGQANNLFIRAFVHSIIEYNVIQDGDRNWCSQTGYTSGYHSILLGNRWLNNVPRRHNSGENMYEAGGATWHGPVASAGADRLAVAGSPWADQNLVNEYVLILDGRGLGQYRRVIANDANTLTVDPPWDIVPAGTGAESADTTREQQNVPDPSHGGPGRETYAMVGRAYVETLWIDNDEENTANWTGFWGNNFGHVVDSHSLRNGAGFYLWAWKSDAPSPVAFCDLIGVRIMGRGNVSLLGPLVFGNTVRFSEVTGFRYGPGFHIQPTWLQGMEPQQRAAVDLLPIRQTMAGVPETAPWKDWNIVEGSHLYDGPRGIRIPAEARHTQLRNNTIHVDGEAVIDESKKEARDE